jgi:hypothetical protein
MPYYPKHRRKILRYPQAPSGFILINKWEPPFMNVKKGFGFIGIVAEDSEDGTLQCHECGIWTEMLCSHYVAKHGMNGDQYRKKFGLLESTALKSKRIRLMQSALISKMQRQGKMNVGNRKNKNG